MSLFVKVPSSMMEKSGDHIKTYCEIYILEFTNKNYLLNRLETKLTYRQCRSLQALARQVIKDTKINQKLKNTVKK